MEHTTSVIEYDCPCCGAALKFSGTEQNLICEYCDNSFEIESVKAFNEELTPSSFDWEVQNANAWTEEDISHLHTFTCQSCGGQLITDDNTAATFCPYCDSSAILPDRLSGDIRPDGVLPFRNTKEDAKNAFLKLCKKKPLLPKNFAEDHRVEKITGIYVPFWLYDCNGTFNGQYKATRVSHWSDAQYHYTKTDHYLLKRQANAQFTSIPMDGSSKTDNAIMESIEPYDYGQMVDFETAYLSGYFADKYDVPSKDGQSRIEERVSNSLNDAIQDTFIGFSSVVPTSKQLQVAHGKAKYVLLPVWMLYTKYKEKTYLFAMNGQTGKMTGSFPICPKRSLCWFTGMCAGITALMSILTILLS